ncbi:Peptidyl-prolyl cis-trans isomerase FKBP17-2, chloroplastic [Linum perenne]
MSSIIRPPPFLTFTNSRSSSYPIQCSSSNQTPSTDSDSDSTEESKIPPPPPPLSAAAADSKRTKAESTDWIASSLTRRFGLGAGLGWAGFLAVGVVSEVFRDVEKEEEVILPNGIKYYELKLGGGATPMTGDLVVINLKGRVLNGGENNDEEAYFVDTFETKKPLALVMGSRLYTRGMCEGVEYVLRTMKGGGKRRVIVPPKLGFGEEGAVLGSIRIPPDSTLEFVVEVDRVSIAPV